MLILAEDANFFYKAFNKNIYWTITTMLRTLFNEDFRLKPNKCNT